MTTSLDGYKRILDPKATQEVPSKQMYFEHNDYFGETTKWPLPQDQINRVTDTTGLLPEL